MINSDKNEKLYTTNFVKNRKYQIFYLIGIFVNPLIFLPIYFQSYSPLEKLKEKILNKFSDDHVYSQYKATKS